MKTKNDSYNELTDEEIIAARERLDRILNERGLKESEIVNVTVTVKEKPNPLGAIGSIISDIAGSTCFILSVVVWGVILTGLYACFFT